MFSTGRSTMPRALHISTPIQDLEARRNWTGSVFADPKLRMSKVVETLETRLVLLHRRLAERSGDLRIQKSGRGRSRLVAARERRFEEIDKAPAKNTIWRSLSIR
jgi:hypothetical protein